MGFVKVTAFSKCLFLWNTIMKKESSKKLISKTFPKIFENFKHEHSICTISTASSFPPVSPVLSSPEIHILFFNNCFWSWGENIREFEVSSLKNWLSISQQSLTVHSSSFLEPRSAASCLSTKFGVSLEAKEVERDFWGKWAEGLWRVGHQNTGAVKGEWDMCVCVRGYVTGRREDGRAKQKESKWGGGINNTEDVWGKP